MVYVVCWWRDEEAAIKWREERKRERRGGAELR